MQNNRRWYIALALVGVLAMLLGACLGAVGGGFVGYRMGRNARTPAGQSVAPQPRQYTLPRRQPQPQAPQPPVRAPTTNGAWVTAVTADSPASKAGMQPGDVITAVDGVQVDEQNTLQALISKHKPGDTVELGLSTAGKDRTLRVQLAARSENSEAAFLGVTYVQTSEMPTPEMKVH